MAIYVRGLVFVVININVSALLTSISIIIDEYETKQKYYPK